MERDDSTVVGYHLINGAIVIRRGLGISIGLPSPVIGIVTHETTCNKAIYSRVVVIHLKPSSR